MTLVCFHGENPHVIDRKRADVVLYAISDPDRRKIIGAIRDDFKTANQVCRETGLAISTVYRRINELNQNNLLIATARVTKNGKEFSYKSKIRKVVATFDNAAMDVQIHTNLRD